MAKNKILFLFTDTKFFTSLKDSVPKVVRASVLTENSANQPQNKEYPNRKIYRFCHLLYFLSFNECSTKWSLF